MAAATDAGHRDPGVLEEMYWDREMTQEGIGDEFGVSAVMVSTAMREHGIPRRGSGMTDEQVLDEIRRVARVVGRVPSVSDWEEHGRIGYATVSRRFGTYGRGRRIALE